MLPVEYYHVVFTLPAAVAALAWYNKALLYRLLFETAAQTLCTIAADPKHLGARIGATLVLHTWGSALTHHPHVHGIVPGGGTGWPGACEIHFTNMARVHQFRSGEFYQRLQAIADASGSVRIILEAPIAPKRSWWKL